MRILKLKGDEIIAQGHTAKDGDNSNTNWEDVL